MRCSLGVAPLWDTAPVTPPPSTPLYSTHPCPTPHLPPHSKCGCVVAPLWGAIPSPTKYPTTTTTTTTRGTNSFQKGTSQWYITRYQVHKLSEVDISFAHCD